MHKIEDPMAPCCWWNALHQLVYGCHKETANVTSCSEIVFWKCKLWMVITSMFVLLIIVIILSLTFHSVVYIDEDEYWDPELIASGHHHNFSGTIKINCANPDQLLSESASNLVSEHLSKMLTDVYSDSPALGRYFISAEVIPVRYGNKTAASYQLCFSVPPETEDFMRYQMSKEFVMNVLRQNIYDQEGMYGLDVPGCINMTLDPTSLLLTRKLLM
ncbi:TPA-induced transmembrane protein [Tiliqua scincoides]|uniref:TPA-induced transmembrane protein n=1 Tax=Tiliqua scincoides TaxID=71010 RepID=UPI0034618A71